jgi:hypothetical protein
MIAYHTPTVGIRCRAFTFLLYNVFLLFSCLLLIVASYVSDCRSWRIELPLAGQQVDEERRRVNAKLRILGSALNFDRVGLIDLDRSVNDQDWFKPRF